MNVTIPRNYSQESLVCRSTSHTRSATPPPPRGGEDEEDEERRSLGDLRLSDSEPSSFRRDDKGRISITKKSECHGAEREIPYDCNIYISHGFVAKQLGELVGVSAKFTSHIMLL